VPRAYETLNPGQFLSRFSYGDHIIMRKFFPVLK
jgi:hypothetical protein